MRQAWPLCEEAAPANGPAEWVCVVCGGRIEHPDAEGVGTLYFVDSAPRERRVEFRVHHACAVGITILWEHVRDLVPAASPEVIS